MSRKEGAGKTANGAGKRGHHRLKSPLRQRSRARPRARRSVGTLRPAEPATSPLPILAELLPRGDGTYWLKPRTLDGHLESWISTARASVLLGVPRRSLYTLMDPGGPYLVWRRPLKNKIMISLKSIHNFIQATTYPDFWTDGLQQKRLQAAVRQVMAGG